MANIVPAKNIQYAAVAAFVVGLVEHMCNANGIVIPPDVADSLTPIVTVLVAHLVDVYFPDAPPPAKQEPAAQAAPK